MKAVYPNKQQTNATSQAPVPALVSTLVSTVAWHFGHCRVIEYGPSPCQKTCTQLVYFTWHLYNIGTQKQFYTHEVIHVCIIYLYHFLCTKTVACNYESDDSLCCKGSRILVLWLPVVS